MSMEATKSKSVKHVPTYCYNCVSGPDFMTVKVVDGVATEVEPNFAAENVHPAKGRVCVKAYGLVQKTYNPNRILSPMKRTNPKKGRDQDPGFVPISWRKRKKANPTSGTSGPSMTRFKNCRFTSTCPAGRTTGPKNYWSLLSDTCKVTGIPYTNY